MISIISLGNNDNRNEIWRLESIFDLMDFNGAGKISSDEVTILLLCVASSFTFIMEGRVSDEKSQTYEHNAMQLAKQVLNDLNKKPHGTSLVKKEEFCGVIRDRFFGNGVVLINDLFHQAVQVALLEGEQAGHAQH